MNSVYKVLGLEMGEPLGDEVADHSNRDSNVENDGKLAGCRSDTRCYVSGRMFQ